MKFEQKKEYEPLAITLETEEEYYAMANIIDSYVEGASVSANDKPFQLACKLADKFSHNI